MRRPAHDVLGFGWAAWKQRRTHPQDVRPVIWQSHASRELLASTRRTSIEPAVEALSTGDDHAIGWNRVHRHRFMLLDLVPHEQTIGHVADDRFARPMIPAPDADSRGDPSRPDAAQQVKL